MTIHKETDLLCFSWIKDLPEVNRLASGAKIGCKLSKPNQQWIEKWAEFTLSDSLVYKYFCKFWMTATLDVESECKL